MSPRHGYSSSSSSASSRASSSSSAALARELGGLSINSKKAPSDDPKYSSPKYAEPERKYSSKHASSKYETTLITPDTSRSRTSESSYGDPSIRYDREPCRDPRSSKTNDSRYYSNSFNDAKYTTSSPREDSRFYPKSSYYERRQ